MADKIEADKTVIVAVDRSKHAEQALEWYLTNVHKPENRVILLHIPEEPPLDVVKNQGVKLTDGEIQQLKEHEELEKQEISKRFEHKLAEAKVKGELKTVYGKPGEVIVEAAKTLKATLIVTGTRGMGKLRRTILGSVSDYVVHHAHCPVLICPTAGHNH